MFTLTRQLTLDSATVSSWAKFKRQRLLLASHRLSTAAHVFLSATLSTKSQRTEDFCGWVGVYSGIKVLQDGAR